MSAFIRFGLVLVTLGLLGMGVPPAGGPEEEDEALIQELDAVVERAAAENYEFLRSLEVLQDVPRESPVPTEEEAN